MIDRMSNTSRLVDKLCIKNLVERTTCKDDRRAVDLKITNEGLELLARIDNDTHRADGELITLSDEDLRLLNGLLDKLRDESNYVHTS